MVLFYNMAFKALGTIKRIGIQARFVSDHFFHNLVLKAPKGPDLRLIFVLAVNVAIGSVWLGSFRERDQER